MSIPYWRLSGFYCCYFATLGAFLPFWSLYLKQIGFAADQIGELTAMLIATKIVSPYLWGWLADRHGKSLGLIRLTSCLSALLFSGFLLVDDYLSAALVTVSFSFFWNAVLPQFETATLAHLHTEPQRYSHIRLWGSVGFILAVLGIGRLLDNFSIAWLPHIITLLLLSNAVIAFITPEAQVEQRESSNCSIWQLLSRPESWAFFLIYMLLQISHGPYYVFYSVYLKQQGYSGTITGMLWALGVCAEIVLFVFAGRLLARVSLRRLLCGTLIVTVLRWWLIAYAAQSIGWLLFAQTLHAASFGLAHVVAIQLLHRYFGGAHQGRGQALYASFSFGLGGMVGSLYSGYFWEMLGGSQVYLIAASTSGVALLIAFLAIGKSQRAELNSA